MNFTPPPPLKPGDTIGIMAPSSKFAKTDLESGAAYLREHGYDVYIHPQCYEALHQSAGTAAQKVSALHSLAEDKSITAVIFACGGNRALHMIDHIDYNLLAKNPKIYMGFSDNTFLLNAITAKTGIVTYHGPTLRRLLKNPQRAFNLALLEGKEKTIPLTGATVLKKGTAQGILAGGNLSALHAMTGDDFIVEENTIVFLEDCNEELSRIDRMICSLKRRGLFDGAAAVIFGQFTDMQDTGTPFGFSFEDIVREHMEDLNIPILINAPFGHGQDLTVIPIRQKATLKDTTLTLLP